VGHQTGALARLSLLGLEQPPLVLVRDLGCEDVQHPASEESQLARTEAAGLVDQVLLGPQQQVVWRARRQVVEAAGDHSGLRRVDPAVRKRFRDAGPPAVQRLGQAELAARAGPVAAGAMGQPLADVAEAFVLRDVRSVRQHPQPELLEASSCFREGEECLAFVGGLHEGDLDVPDVLELVDD
jgi:hypothetical protein